MPKITGLKQLFAKKYDFLPDLSPKFKRSFGDLVNNFTLIIFGKSGQGKSNGTMLVLKELMPHGNVLYVALEEGTASTMQMTAMRHLNVDDHTGKIKFAENDMTIEDLDVKLAKRKSERFIVIDSIQYSRMDYEKWKWLRKRHPKKSFLLISHAKPSGNSPRGKAAEDIEYDVDIKVHVEGKVMFVRCRYGGNRPFIINEEEAKLYWGDLYKSIEAGAVTEAPSRRGAAAKKAPRKKAKKQKQVEE